MVLLNGALNHHKLCPVYFHPNKANDKLLAKHQREFLTPKIRLEIKRDPLEEAEIEKAKCGPTQVGYDRAEVINTGCVEGEIAAAIYIQWYNNDTFPQTINIPAA